MTILEVEADVAEAAINLQAVPLFRALPEEGRQLVLERCRPRHFAPRATVVTEGEPGDELFIVVSGRCVVQATTVDGAAVTFTVLGPGQTFGELALVDGRQRRTGTVVALSELDTLVLRRADFVLLRESYPAVDRLLVEALAAQVERLSRHLLESLYVPVEQRIIRRLIAVAGLYGGLEPGVTVVFTQEDLASLAGTTRPTVNGVLRSLEDEGGLVIGRGRVEIVDPQVLRRRARPAAV
jgi:CRP/FNR family transcriptional regulator, cyclic AMP receptor protein